MAQPYPALLTEFPFATLLRSSDRDQILIRLVVAVWDSLLQFPILIRAEHGADTHAPLDLLVGTIRITGPWPATVALIAPAAFAADCAVVMYSQPAATLSAGDIADAWGELSNIVGGNLKALLPPPSLLSLPEVEPGASFVYAPSGTRAVNDLTFAAWAIGYG